MKKNLVKTAAACGLCLSLLATGASAAFNGGAMNQMNARTAYNQMETMFGNQQMGGQMGSQLGAQMGGQFGQMGDMTQNGAFGQMQNGALQSASTAGELVDGATTNSAASLTADYANATTITMSESNSQVKITEAGTYIITGTCSDGNITVKKGTTGVVLILKDLDLTSTTGATLSINKNAEAKIIISGSVKLTDNENPDDENSTDADVADAYDGAAIKVKDGASAYITGTGTLTVNGTAKNGIKAGDDTALVIDGATINITAANDGINGSYDVAILSGSVTVSAGDDAIHADHILTIGENGNGPTINVKSSTEGIEASIVNLAGGNITVNASDDGVNAANSDGTYASELTYSINITGANVTVKTSADGLDSNGNINLVSGSATISSANNGGDAGMDYDGSLYISDSFTLNNQSGVSNMGGGMMGGQMGQMGGMQQNGQQSTVPAQNQQNTAPSQNQQSTAPSQNQQNAAPSQNTNQAPVQNQQGMNQMPMQNTNQAPAQNQQGMNQMPMQNTNQAPAQNQQNAAPNQSMNFNQQGNAPVQNQQGGMMQNPMQGQQFGAPNQGQMPMQNQQGMMGGMPGNMGGMPGQMGGMANQFGGMFGARR